MRIFKHWHAWETSLNVKGTEFPARVYGGSNRSLEAARLDAENRFLAVPARIRKEKLTDTESYEADIREEPLLHLDESNIVTRNRYGAEVLNSTDHMFVDVDKAPQKFMDLFRRRTTLEENKQRILQHVAVMAETPLFLHHGIRVYETHKGVRVLLTGHRVAPASGEAAGIMKKLGADGLYRILCRKQGCYRARLTPKPYRIGCAKTKVTYPRNAEEDAALASWVSEYAAACAPFTTCRLLATFGKQAMTPVIQYHDERTGSADEGKLA